MDEMSIGIILRVLPVLSYGLVAGWHVTGSFRKSNREPGWVRAGLTTGLIFHIGLIAALWINQGYFPFNTVFHGLLFTSLVFSILLILIGYTDSEKNFSIYLWPVNFCLFLISAVFMKTGGAVPPLMRSSFFFTHVILLFSSYACFIFSFAVSLMYLIQYHLLKKRILGPASARLPSLAVMDRSILRADGAGVGLLFLGLLQGYFWIQTAGTDPERISLKAGLALIAGMIYLSEHILRIGKGWQGSRAGLLSITGFVFVIITMLAGRHGF